MKVPLLDLKAQYAELRAEIRAAMDAVCDEQQFILGPRVQTFEAHVAAYCGVPHAVGLSSGTDALLAALMALEVGCGDAVITTPFTFFAALGAILRLGAFPLLADIDPVTFNLSPERVRALLSRPPHRLKKYVAKAKVLLPVHLFGQCADMAPLLDLARQHGLRVIEDAAQAIGAEYPTGAGCALAGLPGRPESGSLAELEQAGTGGQAKAGSLGAIGCFSFFPSKNLGGFGDGGMAVTRDAALAATLRELRAHGSSTKYRHDRLGGNFRLDALQAAVLDVKLSRLESWHAQRRAHAAFYEDAFRGTAVQTPRAVYADNKLTNYHTYNQYVVRIPERDRVYAALQRSGIGCEIYYPVPMHLQPCLKHLGYQDGDFPESEQAAREVLALPIYPELTESLQQAVVDEVLKATAAK
ncbi:MAG: DegT/DnrJ/EryC1/StrS family aminotransferase [Lentisphaerae bacterium]|nr:DegT/DnrJ/EryC1/StrS family aminotransferase [Lentisphaerota bacterium]